MRFIIFLFFFSSSTAKAQLSYTTISLTKSLDETSGLERFGDYLISHNDSGDDPKLYIFDTDGEKILEVETTLALETSRKDLDKINTKIIYSTLIEVDGDINEKKGLEEIILVKVPTEVFSEIRNLFVLLFEKSGFNQIKIDKNVDFKKLYEKRSIQ